MTKLEELQNKLLSNDATMQEWIDWETRERKKEFWGEFTTIKPVISEKIIGDGKQLIYIGTIDQRPNYWLIRIDSKTDVLSDDFDIEEYLEILEDEFGRHPNDYFCEDEFLEAKKNGFLEEYDTYKEYDSACQYPAIWWGGGHWGSLFNESNNVTVY